MINLLHAACLYLKVFTPQVMETFVVRTILPKLVTSLQMELRINPHKQNIGESRAIHYVNPISVILDMCRVSIIMMIFWHIQLHLSGLEHGETWLDQQTMRVS